MRVRVPATSANLGPGFDCFGLALSLCDDVVAEPIAHGVEIDVAGEGAADLPRSADHLIARSAYAAFAALGVPPPGLRLCCTNRIPHGRGLGSSAAAICAGVLAARALAPNGVERLDDHAVFALAARLEGHPDNVAACLYGGFTLSWADAEGPEAVSLAPAATVVPVAFIPTQRVPTSRARALLPATVPHGDAAWSAARAALLVEALTRRPELLLAATDDRLHQPYRAAAMPATSELVGELRARRIPAVVSGAGPSVLALAPAEAVSAVVAAAPAGWRVEPLAVATSGATVEWDPAQTDQPDQTE